MVSDDDFEDDDDFDFTGPSRDENKENESTKPFFGEPGTSYKNQFYRNSRNKNRKDVDFIKIFFDFQFPISIFDQNFQFRFLTTISIFDQNFQFRFLTKISNFDF